MPSVSLSHKNLIVAQEISVTTQMLQGGLGYFLKRNLHVLQDEKSIRDTHLHVKGERMLI